MKRGILFLLFAVIVSVVIINIAPPLSEEERQKRAEDYSRLVDSLHAVGYDNDFTSLKAKKSFEENLRTLWSEYFSYHRMDGYDARKNAELLILLGNFDFIAEGLRSSATTDNPYYNDWPRDSAYHTSAETKSFSDDEVLWLMLLLPDSGFPQAHLGLKEVLMQQGKNALGDNSSGLGTEKAVWFYYEKTIPGLLAKINPGFPPYFDKEIQTAFQNADEDIQDRFMQAIDPKRFRNISFSNSPARVFSFGDAEALMKEYPPTGAWEGGYIRAINDPTASNAPARYRYSTSDYNINMSVAGAYEYADQSDALVPVINPADARFAIYEDYADGDFYAAYTGTKDLDLYLLRLNIRIVDLLTGEEIFSESVQSNAPPQEITWTSYHGIGDLRVVDGKYFYNDFDWGRYAAIMESSR